MSAVAGRARMDVLVENQRRRQRILDFLNANGASHAPQITASTGDPHKLTVGTLALMRARHEIASTGTHRAMRYIALVTTTVDAQTMYDAIRDHAGEARRKAESAASAATNRAKHEPWRTVHKAGETPPIKNQGGQGALRRNVHVNCFQNY